MVRSSRERSFGRSRSPRCFPLPGRRSGEVQTRLAAEASRCSPTVDEQRRARPAERVSLRQAHSWNRIAHFWFSPAGKLTGVTAATRLSVQRSLPGESRWKFRTATEYSGARRRGPACRLQRAGYSKVAAKPGLTSTEDQSTCHLEQFTQERIDIALEIADLCRLWRRMSRSRPARIRGPRK